MAIINQKKIIKYEKGNLNYFKCGKLYPIIDVESLFLILSI